MLKRFFVTVIILSSALVDLPSHISVGRFSASGVLTILITVGLTLILVWQLNQTWRGLLQIWPLSSLLLVSVLQCLLHRPSIQGFRNICLLLIFIGLIVAVPRCKLL